MKRIFSLVLACIILSSTLPSMASASTVTSTSLINTARSYIGVPYKYGGSTPAGFDCSGYTQEVFNRLGINLGRTTSQQFATGTSVSKSNLKTGDLVFFNTSGKGVSHVGIYLGSGSFIHASTSQGVMISSVNDPAYWGKRYLGAKRIVDLTPPPTVASASKPAPAPVIKYPTRADIAEAIANELGLTATSKTPAFKDVSANHPQLDAINAVAEAGIFTGSNGSFNPDSPLTRAQLSKVLVEAFNLEGSAPTSFPDVTNTHWAKDYISTLYYNDITTGYANGYYGVNDNVTLLQLKKFIERIDQ